MTQPKHQHKLSKIHFCSKVHIKKRKKKRIHSFESAFSAHLYGQTGNYFLNCFHYHFFKLFLPIRARRRRACSQTSNTASSFISMYRKAPRITSKHSSSASHAANASSSTMTSCSIISTAEMRHRSTDKFAAVRATNLVYSLQNSSYGLRASQDRPSILVPFLYLIFGLIFVNRCLKDC